MKVETRARRLWALWFPEAVEVVLSPDDQAIANQGRCRHAELVQAVLAYNLEFAPRLDDEGIPILTQDENAVPIGPGRRGKRGAGWIDPLL
jgi:hypothetical protein